MQQLNYRNPLPATFKAAILLLVATWLQGSGIVQQAYTTIQNEGMDLLRRSVLNFTGTGITCSDSGGVTVCDVPGASADQQHVITFVIDGGGAAIAPADLNIFPTANFSCTVSRWDISADQSGDIEVEIWKAAGAIPDAMDLISGTDPPTLSGMQLDQNGSVAGWTDTTVAAGDVFGGEVTSAMTVERVTVQIWCD